MRKNKFILKIDLTKINTFFHKYKLFFSLLSSCLIVPLLFGVGYISITKEYHFILYNFLIGLFIFTIYELIFHKSIYYKNIKK